MTPSTLKQLRGPVLHPGHRADRTVFRRDVSLIVLLATLLLGALLALYALVDFQI